MKWKMLFLLSLRLDEKSLEDGDKTKLIKPSHLSPPSMRIQALRPVVMSRNGMVSSGHYLASQVGLRVLMDGGNAADAAVAVSAALCVTRPHMCGLGGDGFATVYSADEDRVFALNGSGAAPMRANIDHYTSKGLRKVPLTGPLSIAVPGLVDTWSEIWNRFGTKPLQHLLHPSIEYASKGIPVYKSLADAIKRTSYDYPESIPPAYFVNGAAPRVGDVLTQPGLAETLRKVAEGGGEAFYRGEIAGKVCSHVRGCGGLLDEEDLASHRSKWYPPLEAGYRGCKVFGQPPVSQGHILMEVLNVLDGFSFGERGFTSPDSIHIPVEAKKLAFQDRFLYLTDPDFQPVPVGRLLLKGHAEELQRRINMSQASSVMADEQYPRGGETTYFAVVDKDGNAVSFIQSIFMFFGSGVIVEGTGIALNNRLSSFSLNRSQPNHLEPGKKPAHTLNTYMVFKDDHPYLVGGTPGLDDQVQTNAQILMNILDFGMNVQEAIEAPRWSSRPGSMPGDEAKPYELWLEDRFPEDTVRLLEKRGHRVVVVNGWSFGGAEIIAIDQETGVLMGGADPRRDGYALGW